MGWFQRFRKSAERLVHPERIPNHIAIIMDGNGRWARARHVPRAKGHYAGAEALRRTLRACHQAGVRYLTVYAFSSENWKRPATEIKDLMGLLQLYLAREVDELHGHGVRIHFIGDRRRLGDGIREQLAAVEAKTAGNSSFHLTIAISYGARLEMAEAVRQLVARTQAGEIEADTIDERDVAAALYTADLPDPDLLIRTGGEHRLSNFMLWQAAYAELYFTPVLWPDFDEADLAAALAEYARRERRFGATEQDQHREKVAS